jgi:pimeloyl-ACP methyl ester carboxylesterase
MKALLTIALSAAAATCMPGCQAAYAQAAPHRPDSSGYIAANGINYWFEIHGTGEPLLLLHGGLGSTDMFGPVLGELARSRRVIGVDLHGHGRTELGARPISLIDIGNDLAVIVRRLGLEKVDVMGYSFGGGAALRLVIQHPTLVRRAVIASAPYARSGFFAEMLEKQAAVGAGMFEMMKETPMYKGYAAIAPKPEDFPRLLDAMGVLMREPNDWGDEVKQIKVPVMLVFGDSDMIRPEHMVSFYQLLGGGLRDAGWQREDMSQNRLAILPDVTHYELFAAPALVPTVLPFLNGVSAAKAWAGEVRR